MERLLSWGRADALKGVVWSPTPRQWRSTSAVAGTLVPPTAGVATVARPEHEPRRDEVPGDRARLRGQRRAPWSDRGVAPASGLCGDHRRRRTGRHTWRGLRHRRAEGQRSQVVVPVRYLDSRRRAGASPRRAWRSRSLDQREVASAHDGAGICAGSNQSPGSACTCSAAPGAQSTSRDPRHSAVHAATWPASIAVTKARAICPIANRRADRIAWSVGPQEVFARLVAVRPAAK